MWNCLVKLVTMIEKAKGSRRKPPTISLPTGAPEVSRTTGPTVLARVAPRLLVSGYEATVDLARLQTHGVTHVLNLAGTQSCPPLHPCYLVYQNLHIPDNPKVDILCFLYLAFEFITAALEVGGCVLVHCSQGISRAPTVACAYLMWSAGLSQSQALALSAAAVPGRPAGRLHLFCASRSLYGVSFRVLSYFPAPYSRRPRLLSHRSWMRRSRTAQWVEDASAAGAVWRESWRSRPRRAKRTRPSSPRPTHIAKVALVLHAAPPWHQ